ncbi:MAG: ATP-binding protein [Persicimonas sp.]
MTTRNFTVLVLGELPEADDLAEHEIFGEEYPCNVERVVARRDFAEAVRDPSVDIILIDVAPHGIDVLRTILDQRPMRPMIMVADADNGAVILKAKRMGLERYIIRLADESLNAELLAQEVAFTLKQLVEPPSMQHPTVEEFFRFAQYHNVRQPFYVLDRSHRLLYVNASGLAFAEAVHGVDLHQGDSYEHFPLTAAPRDSLSHLDRALDGEKVKVECTYEELSAADRHREVQFQPILDASEDVVGVSIVAKNIGPRRQVEERLERQEEALWSFFELAPLPLEIIDSKLTIHRANDALVELLGYNRPEELQGVALEELVHDDDFERVRNSLRDLFEGDAAYSQLECRYRRRDGDTVWIDHVDFRLPELGNAEPGRLALSFNADISRQKEAERRDAQSRRMRAIGELAAGVAHDFNNLLEIVQNYGAILSTRLQERGDDEDVGFTDKILDAVDRGRALTRQLLTFGEESEGESTPVDLNAHIREMHALLEKNLSEAIDVHLELTDDVPTIEINPSQLDQVLSNLAINAEDAMDAGGQLRLRTRRESNGDGESGLLNLPSGDYAVLEVSDTGEGMDEKTRRHIFEPFFTTKEGSQGTGLGLSTVYRIVERSGGQIHVESTPGSGTTFTVYLPAFTEDREPNGS